MVFAVEAEFLREHRQQVKDAYLFFFHNDIYCIIYLICAVWFSKTFDIKMSDDFLNIVLSWYIILL